MKKNYVISYLTTALLLSFSVVTNGNVTPQTSFKQEVTEVFANKSCCNTLQNDLRKLTFTGDINKMLSLQFNDLVNLYGKDFNSVSKYLQNNWFKPKEGDNNGAVTITYDGKVIIIKAIESADMNPFPYELYEYLEGYYKKEIEKGNCYMIYCQIMGSPLICIGRVCDENYNCTWQVHIGEHMKL